MSVRHAIHGFYAVLDRDDEALAHAEIDDLLATGRRPIVVGGTGLYLRAALAEATIIA